MPSLRLLTTVFAAAFLLLGASERAQAMSAKMSMRKAIEGQLARARGRVLRSGLLYRLAHLAGSSSHAAKTTPPGRRGTRVRGLRPTTRTAHRGDSRGPRTTRLTRGSTHDGPRSHRRRNGDSWLSRVTFGPVLAVSQNVGRGGGERFISTVKAALLVGLYARDRNAETERRPTSTSPTQATGSLALTRAAAAIVATGP